MIEYNNVRAKVGFDAFEQPITNLRNMAVTWTL